MDINLSHKELIVEILEKADPAIIDRFKDISKQIREHKKDADNLVIKIKVILEYLKTKIDVLVAEQEKLISKIFFNK